MISNLEPRVSNRIVRWFPAILLMLLIFIASAIPGDSIPDFGGWDFSIKKCGHMLGYALLAIAYIHSLTNGKNFKRQHFILALCFATLYSISDEFHQRYVPGRHGRVADVLFDAGGALIMILLIRRMSWLRVSPLPSFVPTNVDENYPVKVK